MTESHAFMVPIPSDTGRHVGIFCDFLGAHLHLLKVGVVSIIRLGHSYQEQYLMLQPKLKLYVAALKGLTDRFCLICPSKKSKCEVWRVGQISLYKVLMSRGYPKCWNMLYLRYLTSLSFQ